MLRPLETLQHTPYMQNQTKNPSEGKMPDGGSKSERTASLGFYPDSQIPSVVEKESGGLKNPWPDDGKNKKNFDTYECQTCKNRKYQDGSNDPGVSYKTPTNISPEQAASSVRAHEHEHVGREQAKAEKEGRKVVSQSVTYQTGICPECGKVYVSGGTTRTVTKAQLENTYNLGESKPESGQYLNLTA